MACRIWSGRVPPAFTTEKMTGSVGHKEARLEARKGRELLFASYP
jgi:hypothetical protein